MVVCDKRKGSGERVAKGKDIRSQHKLARANKCGLMCVAGPHKRVQNGEVSVQLQHHTSMDIGHKDTEYGYRAWI